MTDRRTFMTSVMRAGVALPTLRASAFSTLFRAEAIVGGKTPVAAADDEAYWSQIQMAFDDDRTLVNLNNGGVSPRPPTCWS